MPTVYKAKLTGRYYLVGLTDRGIIEVRARHPKAKQALFGWAGDYGSTKDEGAIQLYGTEDFERIKLEGPCHIDWAPWMWKLDAFGVASLRKSFKLGLEQKERFETTQFEARRYRELLDLVDRVIAKGAGGVK